MCVSLNHPYADILTEQECYEIHCQYIVTRTWPGIFFEKKKSSASVSTMDEYWLCPMIRMIQLFSVSFKIAFQCIFTLFAGWMKAGWKDQRLLWPTRRRLREWSSWFDHGGKDPTWYFRSVSGVILWKVRYLFWPSLMTSVFLHCVQTTAGWLITSTTLRRRGCSFRPCQGFIFAQFSSP